MGLGRYEGGMSMKTINERFMYYAGILATAGANVDDLKHISDLLDLEEQGRLIKLPCKVGDTAYHVYKEYLKDIDKWIKAIVEVEVDSFIININLLVNVSLRIGHDVFRKTLTPYKTLFFTKEEAEKALAEMGE
jgi:hypothetical protein